LTWTQRIVPKWARIRVMEFVSFESGRKGFPRPVFKTRSKENRVLDAANGGPIRVWRLTLRVLDRVGSF